MRIKIFFKNQKIKKNKQTNKKHKKKKKHTTTHTSEAEVGEEDGEVEEDCDFFFYKGQRMIIRMSFVKVLVTRV